MATSASFSNSVGSALTEVEKKHARMMFKYCSQDQSPFLTRAQLQKAVEFFIAQQKGIQDYTKKFASLMLSEVLNDQTIFSQFIHMLQLIKSCNKGFRTNPEIILDKQFILANLSKKQIVHIDACWGHFDKMKLGYLQKATIKECIDLVLQKYDLSGMCIGSSSNKASSFTALNNNSSPTRSQQPQDLIKRGSLKSQHQRQSSIGEGYLYPANLNIQPNSSFSKVIVRCNSYDSRLLQKQSSVSFTNSPSSRSSVPNQSSPSRINYRPSAFRHTNSLGQLNGSINSSFRSNTIKQTSKSSNFSDNPRSLQRKSNFFSKGAYNPCQIEKVAQWLDKVEVERLVSFEEFANFISQLIATNKLKFSQKAQCQCSIF